MSNSATPAVWRSPERLMGIPVSVSRPSGDNRKSKSRSWPWKEPSENCWSTWRPTSGCGRWCWTVRPLLERCWCSRHPPRLSCCATSVRCSWAGIVPPKCPWCFRWTQIWCQWSRSPNRWVYGSGASLSGIPTWVWLWTTLHPKMY